MSKPFGIRVDTHVDFQFALMKCALINPRVVRNYTAYVDDWIAKDPAIFIQSELVVKGAIRVEQFLGNTVSPRKRSRKTRRSKAVSQ